jgi:hypothetical protein
MENDTQTKEHNLSFDKIEGTLQELTSKAKQIFDPLIERQKEIDSIRKVLSILKRFQFVFNLPRSMKENIEKVCHFSFIISCFFASEIDFFNEGGI